MFCVISISIHINIYKFEREIWRCAALCAALRRSHFEKFAMPSVKEVYRGPSLRARRRTAFVAPDLLS